MKTENAKILVVDDEKTQLETVCRGLFLYGFECQGALNAKEALGILAQAPDRYALVLTDLTMPERSGLELIEDIGKRWPRLKIIVFTGLAETPELEQVRKRGISCLKKPFQPTELADMILKELEG
jgi:two-component system response regulator GlrR